MKALEMLNYFNQKPTVGPRCFLILPHRKMNCGCWRNLVFVWVEKIFYVERGRVRYYRFVTLTKKSKLRSNLDLMEACHKTFFLRTRIWLGNKLTTTKWGWKTETEIKWKFQMSTQPVTIPKPFDPDDLFHQLSYACLKGCGSTMAAEKKNCVSIVVGYHA
ncbi:hypothetical protein AVEN_196002-1 [Araneus ventricosus]|uniref:Uncharacterized protein n=1 Tax=Araneus ventricosus TaxID=182803 RepID=A0A4Y2DRJ5_ARAVE|nr:hypothetical protein AVEN_196002-1 [Araneus ventricosus]